MHFSEFSESRDWVKPCFSPGVYPQVSEYKWNNVTKLTCLVNVTTEERRAQALWRRKSDWKLNILTVNCTTVTGYFLCRSTEIKISNEELAAFSLLTP
jgi:hypothetical protein